MKKAEWARNFWVKAAAFVLAVALVPLACVNAVSLVCAYSNGWWTGGASSLYETDFVRSAVWRQMDNVVDVYRVKGVDVDIKEYGWYIEPSYTNYRFSFTDADGVVRFNNIGEADYVYDDTESIRTGLGQFRSAVAAERHAQDDIYWTLWFANWLRGVSNGAVPALVVCAALLLFLVIFLARVSGRRPGTEEVAALWQERIPFDLYLCGIALGLVLLYWIFVETASGMPGMLPFGVAICLAAAAGAAALLLGTWMTLCARVKLGGWWRNTVVYWVLHLCWRIVKWFWRGLLTLVRSLPLTWRTLLILGVFSFFELLSFLNSGSNIAGVFGFWLCEKLILIPALLWLALQLRRLESAGAALAAGDLDTKVDTAHMYWDFKRHGENLNAISRGMSLAVDKQLRSERLKTELITNVSHDIKTPLTSIINYVGLLRLDPSPEQAKDYLEVLDRQSRRLKKLTEDLVEVSKASTGNVAVNASRRSVSELLLQALGEYGERLDKAQLDAVLTLPEKEAFAWIDGTLLWRVLDNLFSNACKYALPGTRFYVDAIETGGQVRLSFKNVSRDRLNVPADELMERFVRGDASRGGEGSGLGLNIAKSLVELQGGTFALSVDGDLFRADITFSSVQ